MAGDATNTYTPQEPESESEFEFEFETDPGAKNAHTPSLVKNRAKFGVTTKTKQQLSKRLGREKLQISRLRTTERSETEFATELPPKGCCHLEPSDRMPEDAEDAADFGSRRLSCHRERNQSESE